MPLHEVYSVKKIQVLRLQVQKDMVLRVELEQLFYTNVLCQHYLQENSYEETTPLRGPKPQFWMEFKMISYCYEKIYVLLYHFSFLYNIKKEKKREVWKIIIGVLDKVSLKWSFIKETLEDLSSPHNFVNLVWHCISSARMRVISKGICQGDPLSP
ncbi:hypothetical protein GLYMA_02G017301v4 [Glycine max]|nr:hypothetical protein GLYMA_02G017301v4 [Glycine max]